ncbi:MAG: hypothetical protein OSJ72_07505 [Lachnospiraceae bacterium]|nr:hypothetical protein [Lachnospiraceae bacterium]
MFDGVEKKPGSTWRHIGLAVFGLIVAAAFGYMAILGITHQNSVADESAQQEIEVEDAAVSAALSELAFTQEQPEVDSSKEIVKDVLLSNVPKADFSYSFNGKLGDAAVVTREGDIGRFNDGTYPEQTQDVLPLFTEGIEGEAIYLDGSYGVELLGMDALSDSYTIAFWFRADELRDWSPFLLIGSHLLDVGEKQSFLSFNKKTTEEGTQVVPIFNTIDAVTGNSCEIRPSMEDKRCISLNVWNYITVCVDASQRVEDDSDKVMGYLYLNSELIGFGQISKLHLEQDDVKAYLGISCFDELFRASYDEVHIWKQMLNESQISSMYTAYTEAG